MIEDIELKKTN